MHNLENSLCTSYHKATNHQIHTPHSLILITAWRRDKKRQTSSKWNDTSTLHQSCHHLYMALPQILPKVMSVCLYSLSTWDKSQPLSSFFFIQKRTIIIYFRLFLVQSSVPVILPRPFLGSFAAEKRVECKKPLKPCHTHLSYTPLADQKRCYQEKRKGKCRVEDKRYDCLLYPPPSLSHAWW